MQKFIVITSIFEPTSAVLQYSKLKDYHVVVAADKKTPASWSCDGVTFLSLIDQKKESGQFDNILPLNHYSRKMMGYLHAMRKGADIIIDIDDDIVPNYNWRFPELNGEFKTIQPGAGFVNVYRFYSDKKVWPRGFPLQKLSDSSSYKTANEVSTIGVWQGLSDKNPDVDAIYRLVVTDNCDFQKNGSIVLGENSISPYNSQNTLTRKELFPLLYLPAHVSFRFTDILRSLVAQPIMWLYGYRLGFTEATTVQERNEHNLFDDFISEIPMFQHSASIVETIAPVLSATGSIESNLFRAYEALLKKNVVVNAELKVLESWLKELQSL